jgi:mevalonate kinase
MPPNGTEKFLISTPAKLHLIGEHAVVYGKLALLTAIDRHCRVQLRPQEAPAVTILDNSRNAERTLSFNEIRKRTLFARQTWKSFSITNEVRRLRALRKHPLDYSFLACGEALVASEKRPAHGFVLEVSSDIPKGSGLGSSAALSVAIVTAVCHYLDVSTAPEILQQIATHAERYIHGNPSGGDIAAVIHGGIISFRKTSDKPLIEPLAVKIPAALAQNFILIQTGHPVESTGEMVSLVRQFHAHDPARANQILDDQERLALEFVGSLNEGLNETQLTRLLTAAEANLELLGVVSPRTVDLIRTIETSGGAAKISGGGGKTKGSGIVLAYHHEPETLTALATKTGLTAFQMGLGVEGTKIS